MKYRIDKGSLMETLVVWNSYMKRRIHLIACGGTALTLLDIKESTKDIDFIVPVESEHDYLIGVLKDIGYENRTMTGWAKDRGFIFDLFRGSTI